MSLEKPTSTGPLSPGQVGLDSGPLFRLARVFDFATPQTGPGFESGHRVITNVAEREWMLEFLRTGTAVLVSTARMKDVLNPHAGPVVPGNFRTDGTWIWTDAVTYYLEQHSLAPDEELARYIMARRRAGCRVGETDHQSAVKAADFLLNPPDQARTAVWVPGAGG